MWQSQDAVFRIIQGDEKERHREKYEREAQIEQTKNIRNGGTEKAKQKRRKTPETVVGQGAAEILPQGNARATINVWEGKDKFRTEVGGWQSRAVQIWTLHTSGCCAASTLPFLYLRGQKHIPTATNQHPCNTWTAPPSITVNKQQALKDKTQASSSLEQFSTGL